MQKSLRIFQLEAEQFYHIFIWQEKNKHFGSNLYFNAFSKTFLILSLHLVHSWSFVGLNKYFKKIMWNSIKLVSILFTACPFVRYKSPSISQIFRTYYSSLFIDLQAHSGNTITISMKNVKISLWVPFFKVLLSQLPSGNFLPHFTFQRDTHT